LSLSVGDKRIMKPLFHRKWTKTSPKDVAGKALSGINRTGSPGASSAPILSISLPFSFYPCHSEKSKNQKRKKKRKKKKGEACGAGKSEQI
jgi:hypothetical protein